MARKGILRGMMNRDTSVDAGQSFHVLTKPIGPICNLDCKYCFYLEKEKLYPGERKWAMSEEVLEAYVQQYIEGQDVPQVYFAWQGGEPTLLGVEFFQRVVELQRKYAGGKSISNALQTNGTLLDDRWCTFFKEHAFLIGLSIDGPAEVHDQYRVDKNGGTTFEAVMRGLIFLQKHGVDFNTLTVVNRGNVDKPLEVYRFLKGIGSGFLQFIPLVERVAPMADLKQREVGLAEPPIAGEKAVTRSVVTEWSVEAIQYGHFLCTIFDEWVRTRCGASVCADVRCGAGKLDGPGVVAMRVCREVWSGFGD